jgi:hypothetical protein
VANQFALIEPLATHTLCVDCRDEPFEIIIAYAESALLRALSESRCASTVQNQ